MATLEELVLFLGMLITSGAMVAMVAKALRDGQN